MTTKRPSTSIRTLQILVVFILSAFISRASFAGKPSRLGPNAKETGYALAITKYAR